MSRIIEDGRKIYSTDKVLDLYSHTEKELSQLPIVTRRELFPGGFVISDVLTKPECLFYINEIERLGINAPRWEDQNGNNSDKADRVVLKSFPLAQWIWSRVAPHVDKEVEFDGSKWVAYDVNEYFRLLKYEKNASFAKHRDMFYLRDNDRSFYTFNLYLNDGFEGGQTNFFSDDDNEKIIGSVVPTVGLAVLFMHPFLHEGARVDSGSKYIIRSDIMYKKVAN